MCLLTFEKIIIIFICFFAFTSVELGQQTKQIEAKPRYPNELRGFKLIQRSKLKNLIPGFTTAQELQLLLDSFGNNNRVADCDRCVLIKNWKVSLTQFDSREGNLHSIVFYPRKRIPFSKVSFPKQFKKSKQGISDNDIGECIAYEDKYGLSYWIVNDEGNDKYKKGDLYFIEYGIPKAR